MISVKNLFRSFAATVAVDGISFEVQKGTVAGFLGPNGAGKSTTLKILSCYMPATAGTASIAGFDVHSNSLEVRRRIGYMPENSPLYPEMRVTEYLRYRAAIKGVPRREMRQRLDHVLERTGIKDHADRIIGQLSKGYRQRVGLADALVHDPQVLLLDEPTSGFDPNQVREMRETLRELGRDKTLLLSSHILPEIEAVCTHVVVINKGKIVADGEIARLKAGHSKSGRVRVEGFGGAPEDMLAALKALPGVSKAAVASRVGDTAAIDLDCTGGASARESVFRMFVERGWTLTGLEKRAPTLEEIFWKTTTGSEFVDPASAVEGRAKTND